MEYVDPPSPLPARTPLLLSVSEAAELIGVSSATLYRWVKAGDVPSLTVGGRIRVPRHRLEKLLNGQPEGES